MAKKRKRRNIAADGTGIKELGDQNFLGRVAPTSSRTSLTPMAQDITNKMTVPTKDFMGYGHLEAPEVHLQNELLEKPLGADTYITQANATITEKKVGGDNLHPDTGTHVSSRVGRSGAYLGPGVTANVEIDASKPLIKRAAQIDPDTDLPISVARHILAEANKIKVGADTRLPDIPDDEVRRLINENPEIALEGITRLGKVMVVPQDPDETLTFNPLETRARVVGDMRKGYIDDAKSERAVNLTEGMPSFNRVAALHLNNAIQIDCQAVYERWMAAGKGNDLYELRMAPPWANALLVYNNDSGNVWAMHLVSSDLRGPEWTDEYLEEIQWQSQPPADHTIDWSRVRWVMSVQVYCGGRASTGAWVQTVGPLMIWRIAVYDDGEPADIHWTHVVPSIKMHKFNNAMGVLTETLNMCNCVNVEIAYPTRHMPRAQHRRFDRMGVRFSEVHVRPTSRSYKGKGTALADMEMPLHGVRGHYATYGKDGRGLLFGKHAGRFWIPPHMRGTAEAGTTEQAYTIEGT